MDPSMPLRGSCDSFRHIFFIDITGGVSTSIRGQKQKRFYMLMTMIWFSFWLNIDWVWARCISMLLPSNNASGGPWVLHIHYSDVITTTIASQITSVSIVYSAIFPGADQRKHQSSASLALMRGIHQQGSDQFMNWIGIDNQFNSIQHELNWNWIERFWIRIELELKAWTDRNWSIQSIHFQFNSPFYKVKHFFVCHIMEIVV